MTDAAGMLGRTRQVDPAALDGQQHFASLLGQGLACGLLAQADADRLRDESLALLAERIRRFTRGQSSSVPVEQAQRLLGGLTYTAGLALKAYSSPEDALTALGQGPLAALDEAGRRILHRKLASAQLLHRQLLGRLFQSPNVFYRATAVEGLAGFFRLYQPDDFPQELPISADYPVYQPITGVTGIEYMAQYLRCLAYENQFLLLFSAQRVDRLLQGVDAQYSKLLMNLFGPALTAALGCVMTGRPVPALQCDRDGLGALLAGKDASQIETLLAAALERLTAELGCTAGLRGYLTASLPRLSAELHRAAKLGCLEAVVPLPPPETEAPQITLTYGQRMRDLDYDRLLSALMRAETSAEKTALVLERVHALGDLLEVLRDGDWNADDLAALFPQLPLPVLAALMARYADSAFLSDPRDRMLDETLRRFASQLPEDMREQLSSFSRSITFEIE